MSNPTLQHALDYLERQQAMQGVARYMSRSTGLYQWYRHGFWMLRALVVEIEGRQTTS